jgi:hypothetical protein
MMTETKAFVGIIKWNATISYGFGETQGRLSYYLRNYRAAVSDRTIDKNIVGLQHQVDYEILLRLLGRSTDCIVSNLLHTGIITDAYGEAPTVDFPLNMMLCWPLVASDAQAAANKAERVFFAASCIISSMERACLEQSIYPENAISTMRLLKKALEQQVPIHMVESIAEYDTLVASLSIPSAADTEIRTTLTGGGRVIFPESFDLSAGNYVGAGYVLMEAGTDGTIEKISMKISGGLSGGSAEKPVGINTKRPNLRAAADVVPKARSKIPPHMADSKGSTLGDPIDATTGSFITSSTELVLGSGAAPTGLSFTRYLGRVSGDPVGLGGGWTHNYDIRLVFRSPNDINWRNAGVSEFVPLQMGASALGDIVLEGDSSFPPVFPPVANDRMNIRSCVVSALIADWVGEQLVQKRACVVMGNNSFEFVKRPDDSFAPPPAIAATLKKDETDGTYTLEFYKGLQIKFDSTTGKFTHIIDPNTASQNTLTAEYVNGDLWKVTDCYGRHLIFEKQSNGKLGSVTDSTGRSANLVNFNVSYWTDPMGYGNQRMHDIGITDANGNEVFGINTISQISGMFNSFSDASRCGVLFQAMMDDPNRVWEIGICDGMARQTDPDGKTKWLYFDCFGQLRATEHEDGSTTSAFYDGENRLVSAGSGVIVIDSDDWRQWRKMAFWKYDAYNRVTEIARPTIIQGFDSSGPKTTITYEDYVSGTQPGKIQITDAVNNQTVITVDNYNKPVAVETTGFGKSEYEYDARGRLVKLHPASYAPDKWINYDYVEETG